MSLQKRDWITAAAKLMAEKGVDAVKVEVLARQLGVSKGSFYWHFKNRPELLDAVLVAWEQETAWLVVESRKAETPLARLQRLFELIGQADPMADENDGFIVDSAIFLWAQKAPTVAAAVTRVEVQRIGYIAELLSDLGLSAAQSEQRARLMYLTFLGYIHYANRVPTHRSDQPFMRFGAELITLFTATDTGSNK